MQNNSSTSNAVEKFAEGVIRWRWLVIIATMVIVFMAASGARFLVFEGDYRALFKKGNPQLVAYEVLQDNYTKSDNVLFVVAPKSGNVFTQDILKLVYELTANAWKIPYSVRVDSISNYQHTVARGDELIVTDLVRQTKHLTQTDIKAIRDVALNEPQLLNRLVSPQAHVAGANVTLELPAKTPAENAEVVAHARKLVAAIKNKHPDVDIYLTGMTAFNNAFLEASQADMQSLIPLMFAVVIFTLILLLRSMTGTLATFIVLLLSIATAMGMGGWLGWSLTPPSATTPNIVLTLAIADCVHILVSFLHSMRTGLDKYAAMKESLRINFMPVFITSVTTAIGFLSMNFSESPPFHVMGNMVAIGVMAAFILSVTFLPALMVVLPVRVKPARENETRHLDRFTDFVIKRRTPLLWSTSALAFALILLIPLNELNDSFVDYMDESIPFRQAADFANENLGGTYSIDYSLESGAASGISEPVFLKKAQAFAHWLRTQPEVVHVSTITDTFKRLNKNMHGDQSPWYRLPERKDLAAQYLLLYEMSLPYGLDLNNQINFDKSAIRVAATLKNMSTQQMLALETRAVAWLKGHAPGIKAFAASPPLMFSHVSHDNVKSMSLGTAVALVLISLILIAALRSVKLGLISLLPNLMPAGIAFGIWAVMDGEVGMSLAIVTGMTLGIVVDDTVHFLSKYLRARREKNLSAEEAVRYAFSTVGVALLVTSFVLAAGFLVLAMSSFSLNADMGLMTAMVIVIALIFDFLFLPSLLLKLDREKETESEKLA